MWASARMLPALKHYRKVRRDQTRRDTEHKLKKFCTLVIISFCNIAISEDIIQPPAFTTMLPELRASR
jgi:hypothetical protein